MPVFNSILFGSAALLTVYIILRPIVHSLRGKKSGAQARGRDEAGVSHRLLRFLSRFLFVILTVALVWTIFLLLFGLLNPSQSTHATNISTLIVSVATVFSIIMAFYSFIHGR